MEVPQYPYIARPCPRHSGQIYCPGRTSSRIYSTTEKWNWIYQMWQLFLFFYICSCQNSLPSILGLGHRERENSFSFFFWQFLVTFLPVGFARSWIGSFNEHFFDRISNFLKKTFSEPGLFVGPVTCPFLSSKAFFKCGCQWQQLLPEEEQAAVFYMQGSVIYS